MSIGWIRDVYPVRKTAEDSLARGDLFVMEEEGRIVASAIINRIEVPDYAYAKWRYETSPDEIMAAYSDSRSLMQKVW